jgi:hypothetical protein
MKISIKINHFKCKELYIIVGFIMNLVISNMIKHYYNVYILVQREYYYFRTTHILAYKGEYRAHGCEAK